MDRWVAFTNVPVFSGGARSCLSLCPLSPSMVHFWWSFTELTSGLPWLQKRSVQEGPRDLRVQRS